MALWHYNQVMTLWHRTGRDGHGATVLNTEDPFGAAAAPGHVQVKRIVEDPNLTDATSPFQLRTLYMYHMLYGTGHRDSHRG